MTFAIRCLLAAAAIGMLAPTSSFADMAGGAPTVAAPFGPPVQDERTYGHLLLEQLEGRFGTTSSFRWQGEGWFGTDTNRAWFKSEGQVTRGGLVDDGQHEILYDRPITSFFDLQAGVRIDADSHPGRTWAAFGVEGLAPLFFHGSGTAYVSNDGHYAAKLEGSYDLLLTQRLILQPQLELNFYTKDDPMRRVGAGLADLDAGLRLRYEVDRKFAPYVSLTYENKFGQTANFARLDGNRSSDLRFTVGVRTWF